MPSDSGDRKSAKAHAASLFNGGATPPPPPAQSENLPCPRCDSTNTKFCYYNNYNLSQPRHFCKSCRRYWTQGGTLRNVPIGGGTRKNSKRSRANNGALTSSSSCSEVVKVSEGGVAVSENTGSFTSLLSSQGNGFLGFDEIGFGFADKGVWPYQEVNNCGATGEFGYSNGVEGSAWPDQGSLVDGDCFAWPDLAISTTGKMGSS